MQLTNQDLYDAVWALSSDALALTRLSKTRSLYGPEHAKQRKELREKALRYSALSVRLDHYICETWDAGTADSRRAGKGDGGMRHILQPAEPR